MRRSFGPAPPPPRRSPKPERSHGEPSHAKAADSSGSRSSAKSSRAHVPTAPLAPWNSKKGPLRLGAAPHLLGYHLAIKILPDVGGALLSLRLGRGRRLRRQLQHGCLLTLDEFGQQYGLPVRKLERIVVHPRLILVDL